jgi:hypothetical protein
MESVLRMENILCNVLGFTSKTKNIKEHLSRISPPEIITTRKADYLPLTNVIINLPPVPPFQSLIHHLIDDFRDDGEFVLLKVRNWNSAHE